jgi:hypothetical protein
MKTKSSRIDLAEKPFESKIRGNWEGTPGNALLFTELYLKKYYDDLIHSPLPYSLILMKYHPSISTTKHLLGIVNESRHNRFYNWKDEVYKDLFEIYFKSIQNTNKRFTVMNSRIIDVAFDGATDGHSIIFLYDKKYNELEIFDSINTDYTPYKKNINNFFKSLYGSKVKIIYPGACVNIGRTYMEKCIWPKNAPSYLYTSDGFCVVWSLWYLELRFRNLTKTRDQIIAQAVRSLRQGPERICKFIRGYSQFVEKIIKDFRIHRDGKDIVVIVKKDKYFPVPRMLIEKFGIWGASLYYVKSLFGLL